MNPLLHHLGIIPDGTRRWAKREGVSYQYAYRISMSKLETILGLVFAKGIKSVSIYMLSTENLKRTLEDLQPVFTNEEYFIRETLPLLCQKWQCLVVHAGIKSGLPLSYVDALDSLVISTNYTKPQHTLYLLANYNPWDEIVNACNRKQCDEIRTAMWVPESLDLVIRTGTGQLLSNFLPLQSGYAELVFFEKYFNDIDETDIISVLSQFPQHGGRLMGR
jgi:undecaprenyl diphosphate synthase